MTSSRNPFYSAVALFSPTVLHRKGLEFETRKKEYMKELADGKRPDNAVTKAAAHRVVALILASIQSMWKWQTKNEKSLLRKMVYDNEDMFMTQVWIEKKTNSGSKIFQDVQKVR